MMNKFKFLLLISIILFSYQCQEDYDSSDSLESNNSEILFKKSDNAHSKKPGGQGKKVLPHIESIKSEILSKNKNRKFIDRLIRSVGSPEWSEAFSATDSNEGFPYVIPFYNDDSEFTAAVLLVRHHKNGKKLEFQLVERSPFMELLNLLPSDGVTKEHFFFANNFKYFDVLHFRKEDTQLSNWIDTNWSLLRQKKGSNNKNCDQYQVCFLILDFDAQGCPMNPVNITCEISYECMWVSDCSNEPLGGDISGGGSYSYPTGGGSSGSIPSSCYSCEIDANYPQDSDPSAGYPNLNESQYYQLLLEGFTVANIGDIDMSLQVINGYSSYQGNASMSMLMSSHLLVASRLEALAIHASLLGTHGNYRNYILLEDENVPGWLWPFIREVGIEIAKELALRYGPAGVVQDVIQAVANLGQGDMVGFLAETIDIVRRKVPALAAISITLDGIELSGKAASVWRAIVKLENMGDDFIRSFLKVVDDKAGGLLAKINVSKKGGLIIDDVSDPVGFYDALEQELGDFFSDIQVLPPTSLATYELAGFTFNNGVYKVTIKYGGNTNPNGYSIELRRANTLIAKIRL